MFYRMGCPRCGRRIEYTDLQVGHQAHCRRCNCEVTLRGNPFRVFFYLLGAAAIVFIAWGGMRLIRVTMKESRYSGEIVQPQRIERVG
ncbi:MAG TPA: hypothetical protein PLN21_19885 [Gemmatales bacterium]|nr:hypothetical protein [Gemmatales bacterium]